MLGKFKNCADFNYKIQNLFPTHISIKVFVIDKIFQMDGIYLIIFFRFFTDIPCVKILVDSPVRFGSETIIKSVISSTPTPEKIEWQSSKEGIIYYCIGKPSCFGRLDIFKMPSLVIPKTTFNDKLHYRLLVWNGIGESVSNSVYLNVTGSMTITYILRSNILSCSKYTSNYHM